MAHKLDSLGDRMKGYENVNRNYLLYRTPVIIRIDGKSFHTFTRGFAKPFDKLFINAMQKTMKYLCENVQGCVLGYTQSDEITLVLVDYKNLNTNPWFGYNIQKCSSIAASMATMAFNKFFAYEFEEFNRWVSEGRPTEEEKRLHLIYYDAMVKGALFDARCFNVPREEVTNCILWRQNDAIRNSISSLAQYHFSTKELYRKNTKHMKEMLLERGIDWELLEPHLRHGSCCIKNITPENMRLSWEIDYSIPIFKSEGRRYIEDRVSFLEN